MIEARAPGMAVYPEAQSAEVNWLERQAEDTLGRLRRRYEVRRSALQRIVPAVGEQSSDTGLLTDEELRAHAGMVREQFVRSGFSLPLIARSFALVREAAWRSLGMRHYDVQLLGGFALLHGVVAEMETGEGKTLTATLAAATAALAGWPVHVITVNDYLAQRDADEMRPVYSALGLSVGCIQHGMTASERRSAYLGNVTYCSNKEITFDYLKDRIALGRERNRARLLLQRLREGSSCLDQLVLRGLNFAIVDEADSVFIDEARTPLILSRERAAADDSRTWQNILEFARSLHDGQFKLDREDKQAWLTPLGEQRVAEHFDNRGEGSIGHNRARELVAKALSSLYLYHRDEQYVVHEGKVQIVDEFTGRLMPDRSWEGGLHQLIEAKEGVEITPENETLARMTYQRFFRRYLHLAGMTGTAKEVAGELWKVYRLPVVRIPTNRPVIRRAFPRQLFVDADGKWAAVVESARRVTTEGRPVLIGTRSVADSEHVSRLLSAAEIRHEVLNACQDEDEAQIIAAAGQLSRVTVATNMAGRGTDIRLGQGVAAAGGLHVICTQPHESIRIDRQLFGRAGRQGDPGSYEVLWALDDELATTSVTGGLIDLCMFLISRDLPAAQAIARLLIHQAQLGTQVRHSKIRRELLNMDERLESVLAFAGRSE